LGPPPSANSPTSPPPWPTSSAAPPSLSVPGLKKTLPPFHPRANETEHLQSAVRSDVGACLAGGDVRLPDITSPAAPHLRTSCTRRLHETLPIPRLGSRHFLLRDRAAAVPRAGRQHCSHGRNHPLLRLRQTIHGRRPRRPRSKRHPRQSLRLRQSRVEH